MNAEEKREKLEIFEAKQNLTGRIFDFAVSDNWGIYISKYYDTPSRPNVIIPDFVDGFSDFFNDKIFKVCKYAEKVSASSLKGKMYCTFQTALPNQLDLTELNTSNITSMEAAFMEADICILNVGGKFDTSNVKQFSFTFDRAEISKITGLDTWDTSNAINMNSMFARCIIDELDISNFSTESLRYAHAMFQKCRINKLILGDKFDLSNVICIGLFEGCKIGELIISRSLKSIFTDSEKQFRDAEIGRIINGGHEIYNKSDELKRIHW